MKNKKTGDTLRRVLTTLGDPLTDEEVTTLISDAGKI